MLSVFLKCINALVYTVDRLTKYTKGSTVEPPNNGHIGEEHSVHCLEVVPFTGVYRNVYN